MKEAGALSAELQNLVSMGTRLTQSYLDGIKVVKRVKQENDEEYSEPTPDKQMMEELLSKPKSFLSREPSLHTPANRYANLGSLE